MAARKSKPARPSATPRRKRKAVAKSPVRHAAAPRPARPALASRATKPARSPKAAVKRARPGAAPASKRSRGESAAPPANAIGFVSQHLDFRSHDLAGVSRFYTELLGFSEFTRDPRYDYLYIPLGPGVSLGFMPPVPGPPELWRPPREPSLFLFVDDADRAYATLAARGVVFDQPPADTPWGARAAMLRDPEGRIVWIAHRTQKE
jgi:catechol 2,3-dioxygenase-like lactoylglutathione lyase family enzyme